MLTDDGGDDTLTPISASESGSATAPFNFKKGTSLNLNFDNISFDGTVSIPDTGFNQSFSSSSGTVSIGPDEVTLEGGPTGKTYTLVENYHIVASASSSLVNTVFDDPTLGDEVSIERTITVLPGQTLTVKITIDSTIRDLSASISGSLSGSVTIPGTLGSSIPVTVVFQDDISEGDPLSFSGSLSATLASNTVIEAQVSPPTNVAAMLEVDGGGDDTFDTQTFTITVNPVADQPTLSVTDAQGKEDRFIDLTIAATLVDTDGSETLSITIDKVPTGARLSAGTDNGDGSWTLTADQLAGLRIKHARNRNNDFTLKVTATATESDNDDKNSITADLEVTVFSVDDSPSVDNVFLNTPEDTPLSFTFSGSDVEGDSLSFSVVSGPSNGTLSEDGADRTYTPHPDFFGTDSFTYQADDGGSQSNLGTVTITVEPVNDPPVAPPHSATVAEGVDITIALSGKDVDSDALTTIVSSLPTNGALYQTADGITRGLPIETVPTPVTDASGRVIYVSAGGVGDGLDSFGFKVNDGKIDSDEATVLVNVMPSASTTVSMSLTVGSAQSFKFVDGTSHQVTLDGFTDTSAIISVTSTPVTVILAAGASENIDTNGDGVSDLTVRVTDVEVGVSATVMLSNYPPLLRLAISSAEHIFEGDTLGMVIETRNTEDAPATSASDITIHLASSAATGGFDISRNGAFDGTVTEVTIPAGETLITVFYKDITVGTVTITATAENLPADTRTATQEVTVSSAVTSVTASGSPVRAGNTVTVTAIGKPGATAAFSVGDLVADVTMRESVEQAGTYTGDFTPVVDVHPEGTYDVVVKVSISRFKVTDGIVIDNTAPMLVDVTPAPTSIKNGQTLTLTVTGESGLSVLAEVSALDTTQLAPVAFAESETEKGVYRARVVISEDNAALNGPKTVTVTATDLAGNPAEAMTVIVDLSNFAEFDLTVPRDIATIHIPLKVAAVGAQVMAINTIGDLYHALGGADTVNFIITYDSSAGIWRSYLYRLYFQMHLFYPI